MKSKIVIILVFLSVSNVFAQNLTEQDKKKLEYRKIAEHILIEQYLRQGNNPISVLGYHFDTYINDNYFFNLAIFGAIEGNSGGYGIAACGIGYDQKILDNLVWDSRIFVGSGGGGGVPAGGGLAIEAQTGFSYKIVDGFSVDIKYGYLKFLSGSFESPVINFGISYQYNYLYLPLN